MQVKIILFFILGILDILFLLFQARSEISFLLFFPSFTFNSRKRMASPIPRLICNRAMLQNQPIPRILEFLRSRLQNEPMKEVLKSHPALVKKIETLLSPDCKEKKLDMLIAIQVVIISLNPEKDGEGKKEEIQAIFKKMSTFQRKSICEHLLKSDFLDPTLVAIYDYEEFGEIFRTHELTPKFIQSAACAMCLESEKEPFFRFLFTCLGEKKMHALLVQLTNAEMLQCRTQGGSYFCTLLDQFETAMTADLNPILEAMRQGMPIVMAKNGNEREYILQKLILKHIDEPNFYLVAIHFRKKEWKFCREQLREEEKGSGQDPLMDQVLRWISQVVRSDLPMKDKMPFYETFSTEWMGAFSQYPLTDFKPFLDLPAGKFSELFHLGIGILSSFVSALIEKENSNMLCALFQGISKKQEVSKVKELSSGLSELQLMQQCSRLVGRSKIEFLDWCYLLVAQDHSFSQNVFLNHRVVDAESARQFGVDWAKAEKASPWLRLNTNKLVWMVKTFSIVHLEQMLAGIQAENGSQELVEAMRTACNAVKDPSTRLALVTVKFKCLVCRPQVEGDDARLQDLEKDLSPYVDKAVWLKHFLQMCMNQKSLPYVAWCYFKEFKECLPMWKVQNPEWTVELFVNILNCVGEAIKIGPFVKKMEEMEMLPEVCAKVKELASKKILLKFWHLLHEEVIQKQKVMEEISKNLSTEQVGKAIYTFWVECDDEAPIGLDEFTQNLFNQNPRELSFYFLDQTGFFPFLRKIPPGMRKKVVETIYKCKAEEMWKRNVNAKILEALNGLRGEPEDKFDDLETFIMTVNEADLGPFPKPNLLDLFLSQSRMLMRIYINQLKFATKDVSSIGIEVLYFEVAREEFYEVLRSRVLVLMKKLNTKAVFDKLEKFLAVLQELRHLEGFLENFKKDETEADKKIKAFFKMNEKSLEEGHALCKRFLASPES